MINRITHLFSQQATSFVLAAMVTLSMLGGVDQLAQPEHEAVAQQAGAAATQVVVITAKRLSRS